MTISNFLVIDDVLENPDEYVQDVLSKPFVTIPDGKKSFKGIQMVEDDEVEKKLENIYTNYKVVNNFIRQSPVNQDEPNYIHSDRNECDLIAILYLNKKHPKNAGTLIYEDESRGSMVDFGLDNDPDFRTSVKLFMKYNRLIAFPSDLYHSRSIIKNFGTGDNSRLVQVLFLKRK